MTRVVAGHPALLRQGIVEARLTYHYRDGFVVTALEPTVTFVHEDGTLGVFVGMPGERRHAPIVPTEAAHIAAYESGSYRGTRQRGRGAGDPHSPASAMGSVDRAPRFP